MTEPSDLPVLIVGAGPTGLTAAALLGSMGVRALLPQLRASGRGEPVLEAR
jgi:2-polyprenyl-6-methoxyphenol hydroxylase-like FAD-dependent oxidoreductase